mgnify:FL=1
MATSCAAQYIDGLKFINEPFVQEENFWNEISYSWYSLKKNYKIDTCFTIDLFAKIPFAYTAKGLYIQEAPYEQTLLFCCTSGSVLVVIVDLRENSKTYLRKNEFKLANNAEYRKFIYIPRGCAYGFITLEENSELHIKTDNYCKKEFEKTYNILDPFIEIKVPFPETNSEKILLNTLLSNGNLIMSMQDRNAPWLIDANQSNIN